MTPLQLALAQTRDCRKCKLGANRTTVVPGAGDPAAMVAFVGEAPGRSEDEQGLPFVGDAGALLDKMIAGMQDELRKTKPDAVFSRTHGLFVTNVCRCRPPQNRRPERDEIAACLPNFWDTLRALSNLRIVVALGSTPLCALKGDPLAKITRERGNWFDRCIPDAEHRVLRIMPTFHPAYLLWSPWEKPKAWLDLCEVVRELACL